MKRKGSKCDFNSERDKELREAFFSQGIYSLSDPSAMKKTVEQPASRFWVDPERARDVLSKMEKNPGAIDRMNPEKKRMYAALYEKYRNLRRRNPSKSKIDCATMAVYSGAPEFFIAPSTARRVLYSL